MGFHSKAPWYSGPNTLSIPRKMTWNGKRSGLCLPYPTGRDRTGFSETYVNFLNIPPPFYQVFPEYSCHATQCSFLSAKYMYHNRTPGGFPKCHVSKPSDRVVQHHPSTEKSVLSWVHSASSSRGGISVDIKFGISIMLHTPPCVWKRISKDWLVASRRKIE